MKKGKIGRREIGLYMEEICSTGTPSRVVFYPLKRGFLLSYLLSRGKIALLATEKPTFSGILGVFCGKMQKPVKFSLTGILGKRRPFCFLQEIRKKI
jgi:hypothetical protein